MGAFGQSPNWLFDFASPNCNDSLEFAAPSPANAWTAVIVSLDANHVSGEKKFKVYFNDTDATGDITDPGDGFTIGFNGFDFVVGGFAFDLADFRLLPGVSLLDETGDIPLATRRMIIDGDGKPVDPAVLTAFVGATGAVLLSGDSSTFSDNQGSGGAFVQHQILGGTGITGPGATTLTGALLGSSVVFVRNEGGDNITSQFESTISVDGEIQQTSSDDNSGIPVFVTLAQDALTNASTSPSD